MYETIKAKRKVNGVEVTTFARDIIGLNTLMVEAGTNGYKGGDSGHGSRTYLRITDGGGTDISFKSVVRVCGDEGFEVSLGGDSELKTFIKALKFAVKVLEDQANKVDD